MIVFLARSALCIGLVAAAASGVGTGSLTTTIARGAREAADGAGRACLASSDCVRIGAAALSGAALRAPDAFPAALAPLGPLASPVRRAPVRPAGLGWHAGG